MKKDESPAPSLEEDKVPSSASESKASPSLTQTAAQKLPYQIPYNYYNYFYGYSFMGLPSTVQPESYMSYPALYPSSTFRKRVKGKISEYAKTYYSHLGRVNSNEAVTDYKSAKFFVIKSLMEENVHKAMKYQVWSSTMEGNKRLSIAYLESEKTNSPVFLFFSVNGSRQFVGAARMTSKVNFEDKSSHWMQSDKWMGIFKLEWLFIKDIPIREFKHLLVASNENKPVTKMRDAQEVPFEQGVEMLQIFKRYKADCSLLDEFEHYDDDEARRKEAKAEEFFGRIIADPRERGKGRRGRRGRRGRYQKNLHTDT
eukprot:TRINITY_DN15232_c0_g1_i1.p1 TRINITY_DN15232_c0_g1~~TRINITY_DN15232_c0_g1_i1.p1  ORF type:complete len:313 (+),score=67.92 TRINITY_DN15232_c0_g1_i1:158-1096(+)